MHYNQKILDLGVIQGFTDDREAAGQKLISSVVKAVEICFEVSQKDEGIQLQILKVFTTAVNSTVCGVHESNLMTAVRICYNIYLISGEQNRKTAKTTLTSMLNLLFTRFQDAPQSAPSQPGATTEDDDDAEPSGTKTPTETRKRPSVDDAPTDDSKPSEDTLTVDDVDQSEGISRPVTPGPANDPNSSSAPATTTAATPAPAKAISPAEQAYRDCFQTFRGLCKLSMKKIPPNVSNMDSIEVRSKILSLELILSIFDTNTHVFKDHTRFINNALKKNLVMSIMLNGTSSISLVYRTTLAIFVFLVRDFRYHFKVW
jgi:brefeldin A-inhibited guanine nucleotide-exchange protein